MSPDRTYTPEALLGPLNETEKRNAPATLFVAGDVSILRDHLRVAIVGSRAAAAQDLETARSLSAQLVHEGVAVVSGLAAGIDTAAHSAAIAAQGRTVAVLGTPLSQFYPRENRDLQLQIARHHLVVSQFSAQIGARAFPMRNRTLALISHASIVVTAGEKSGTKHQAWEALRMNRPLFFGESVMQSGYDWVEEMLDHGAQPLSGIADVLEALPSLDSIHPQIH